MADDKKLEEIKVLNNNYRKTEIKMNPRLASPNSQRTGHSPVHTVNERHESHPNKMELRHPDSTDVETFSTQPLLEHNNGRQKPPLAGPEIDDLDDRSTTEAAPYPGIDDGLLEPGAKKPEGNGDDSAPKTDEEDAKDPEGDPDGNWWHGLGVDSTDGPYGDFTALNHTHAASSHSIQTRAGFELHENGFGNKFGVDDRPISPFMPGSIPDVNTYQQKKNLAQGMMDLALLSANANQLRYVLESSTIHPYYYFGVVFISLSIILQVAVGIGLILNSRYNVKDDQDICKADKINNFTVLGVFLITVVNVFIAAFSVASPTSSTVTTAVQTTN